MIKQYQLNDITSLKDGEFRGKPSKEISGKYYKDGKVPDKEIKVGTNLGLVTGFGKQLKEE